MNLYDMIATHGKGKGEKVMWNAVRTISDFIEEHDDVMDADELYKKVYACMCGEHYDKELAKESISKMYYESKGIKHQAPYWSDEDMHSVYGNIMHLVPDCYTEYDFWVVLNMLKSDYAPLMECWFGDGHNDKVVEMAVAYLNDPDAKHKDSKIWHYMM